MASKCMLCCNVYQQPKLLPCFHTFCESCLYEYIGNNSRNDAFQCPSCQTDIAVPSNIKTDYKSNRYTSFLPESKSTTSCDICKTHDGVVFSCMECDQTMCKQCHQVHSSMTATKNHITINKVESDFNIEQTSRMCEEHEDEELTFYCRTCKEGICFDCRNEEIHEGHLTDRISNCKDYRNRKLKVFSESLKAHHSGLKIELQALDYRKRLVENSFSETSQSITIQAEEICKIVYKVRDEAIQEAKLLMTESQTKVMEVEAEIKLCEQRVTGMSKYIESVLSSLCDVGIVETYDLVEDNIPKVLNYQCPSLDVMCTEFNTGNIDKLVLMGVLGQINTYPALRLRLQFGKTETFTLERSNEVVDAVCPIETHAAWVSTSVDGGDGSSVSLYDSKTGLLKTVPCESCVKGLALLNKHLHALTNKAFVKLNVDENYWDHLVLPTLPLLIASNSSSMFFLTPDHCCHCVVSTDVRPIDTIEVCQLQEGLKDPTRMIVDDDNQNIVILDSILKTVLIFDFDGVFKARYELVYPMDMCFDKWSDILVVDGGNQTIYEVSTDGKNKEVVYSPLSELKHVSCIAASEESWWFGTRDGKIVVKYLCCNDQ